MKTLATDYTAASTLSSCPRLFELKFEKRYKSFTTNIPMHAGQVAAEGLLQLHTVEKSRWKKSKKTDDTDFIKAHEGVCEVLEASWGDFKTPPGSKHHYLTLGHLETILWYYMRDRDPFQVEPLEESGEILAEKATVFDWPLVTGDEVELIRIGGKPDIPAMVAGQKVIVDWKCSTMYISQWWSKKFSIIGHQLRTYMAMLRHAYGIETTGAYVDGIHMGIKASAPDEAWKGAKSFRSQLFGPFNFTEGHLRETWEWYKTRQLERQLYQKVGHFPQNESSCLDYGGCEFQGVCGTSPVARNAILDRDFQQWTPSEGGILLSGADSND